MSAVERNGVLDRDGHSGYVLPTQFNWEHLVANIALQIRQSLDSATILQVAVDAVRQLLGCDRALLYQFAADKSGQVVVEAVADPQWSILGQTVHDACFEASWLKPYDERQVRAIADVATANLTPCHAEFLAGFQVKANLVVPVLCESQLWGLLIAHSCTAPRAWLPDEITALQQLAVHVGIAIQQASLVAQLQAANADLEAQAEHALRQSRDQRLQLAAIVDSSQDAIISKTPEGIITSWNRAAEQLFGYSAAEAIGQPITLIIPPDRQAESALIFQRLHQGQSIETYETQRQCKDGRLVDVALTISPIQDETGVVIGASKIVRDITAQRQAQRALQEQTAILHSFYNSSPLMMGVVELSDHDILHISDNQATVTFFNTTIEALEGRWASDLGVPPDHILDWVTHYRQSQASGQPVQFDYAHTTDTTTTWLSVVVSYIGLGESQRPRFSYVAADISDRKQAEQALQISEARYAALVQVSPVGIFRTDASGDCLYANTRWCELAELAPEEAQGKGWVAAIHPDDRDRVFAEWYQAAASNQPFHSEYRFQTPAGVVSWLIGQAIAEKDASGETVGYIGTITNITDRKQAESALQASEARWQFALEGSGDGVWDWDIQTNQLFVTRQWKAMLGYADAEIGSSLDVWDSRVHPEHKAQCYADIERHFSGETDICQSEYRMCCKDGSYKWILDRGKVIEWAADGKPLRMIGTHTDISDRKQAELDLKSANDQLQLVLQASSEGFWDWDLITGEIFFSPQWKAMLGYADHELENSPEMWKSLIFEDDLATALQLIDDYNNGRAHDFTATQRFHHKDGSIVHILSRAIHLNDEQGKAVRMVGSHLDITPTVTMQTALKTSEMQLSGILNSSLDGIMAFRSVRDGQGTLVDFEWLLSNPTSCQMIGRQADDIIGKRLLEELPGNREDGLFDLYVQVVESGEPMQREFYYNHDGIDGWFENIAVKLSDGFAVTFRDITAIKQAEMTLQQTNQQLSDRIGELGQRHSELVVLSEISDFLQACSTVEEACHTIVNLVEPLFPGCSGGVFITRASRNRLECAAAWGSQPHSSADFEPHSCWGLRRGRMHWVGQDRLSLRCSHVPDHGEITATLCIPMIAQGETLGLFYLSTEGPEAILEAKQQLARTLAEQVGMAIANLKLQETLKHQSIRDPLTGLYNRRYLEESITQEIVRAQRNQHSIGVIMIDIDHFKRFNDTFGHDTGDTVLKLVGTLLKDNVRTSDIACRYGGEEMTLILPEVTLAETAARAEKIRAAIGQLRVPQASQEGLSASLGVACFPQHGSTGSALIKAADTALYRAKQAGRNQVLVAL